ncbi:uncharacterized protein Dana_GF24614 [Drosophila ananassae]|uniref:Uncharacterized protein n=1 Tax=Drosophila ananassae TaxID=7217 RepID=B3M3E5_DROAN|nr:uncharacterized protein LOC6507245 [Drosophila ananassae]EDV39206.1 uncharacterized protein Dana_GF24614 [Drosophila ananassae]
MGDKRSEGSQELVSYDSYQDDSQVSMVEASVVPLDTSEDAQFSEQMFNSIQERLTRINKRVRMATSTMATLQKALRSRMVAKAAAAIEEDKMAGGDNGLRRYQDSNEETVD